MKYLLVLLILLNISDAVLTNQIVNLGLGREANPFLLNIVGKPSFVVLKASGVLLAGIILWDIYRRRPKLALVSTSCFVAFYGLIVLWNSSVLLR